MATSQTTSLPSLLVKFETPHCVLDSLSSLDLLIWMMLPLRLMLGKLCLYTEGVNSLNLPRTVNFQSQLHTQKNHLGGLKPSVDWVPKPEIMTQLTWSVPEHQFFFLISLGDSNIKPRFKATDLELACTFVRSYRKCNWTGNNGEKN